MILQATSLAPLGVAETFKPDSVLQRFVGCSTYDWLTMNAPAPPSPKLGPVDLSESVAGEEDPGASLDLLPAPPERFPAGRASRCARCGGSGKLAIGTCPDCKGTGEVAAGL